MRHIVLGAIIFANCSAFGQQLALDLDVPKQPPQQLELPFDQNSSKDIIAPVLIKTANEEAQLGLFTVEPTAQRLDALTIIRQSLHEMEKKTQAAAQKDGVFMSTNKRFTPESLAFFIAIGGVTFNSMWIKSHGDPLAMERHILSLKDPIAHLSFYIFMQTQGFYMDFFSKRKGLNAMDATTRSQMMRVLTYQGMAVGSLFSSIAADLGQSVKMCVDQWMLGKTDEASLESCNQAWKSWTARGKFSQYFPQIIALWASQATVETMEAGARWGFQKVPTSRSVTKLLTKEYLVKLAYKISAADVALTFSGGGLFLKGIKLAGKVTRFSLFVGVDHFMANYTYRPVNNLLKPMFFDFDALAINNLWKEADQVDWAKKKFKDPKSIEKFEKEIENYALQMQQWREHLNQDAETDLAGWMEMTKEILNQVDYAYKYYKGFSDNLFQTLNIGHRIKNESLAPTAAAVISRYPMRILPFYGVSTGQYKPVGGKVEDLYITSPNEMEKRQREHIVAVATKFKEVLATLKGQEQAKLNSILEKLLSQNDQKMSVGLNEMNQIVSAEEMIDNSNNFRKFSPEFNKIIEGLRAFLGDPLPVVYPFAGYSQAIAANSIYQVTAGAADYSKWSLNQNFRFNKEADLMMYKIICGKPNASLYKVALAEVDFVSPQFDPPTLLNPVKDKDLELFCSSNRTTNNLYSAKIGTKSLQEFMLANLNYSVIGDFRQPNPTNSFDTWWLKSAKEPLNVEFKNFDERFKKLFATAYANFFDQRSFFKFFVDGLNQSKYLPKSLHASLKTEAEVYLQLLNRALLETPVFPKENLNTFNYLEFSRKSSESPNYSSIYSQPLPEITRLRDLLDSYFVFIMQSQVNFDQYIAHSKKIDTAINEIFVKLKLKKVVQGATEDLSAPASASGTESSQKIYEDIAVQDPTLKQRISVAAVKGLKQVESEIRRFIRMRIVLAQSLELDSKEFMTDWNNANPASKSLPKKTNPFGGSR